jgi:glutamine amidotransferase-like uncharacterized protein
MKKTIALFINHPECSQDCCDGMIQSLGQDYNIKLFRVNECNSETLSSVDMVAFPGGIGDASSYDKFFRRKAQNAVADYVQQGGRYLGICMGAYWAGSYYFDILDNVDAVQYIRQPTSDIKRSYSTVASINWNNQSEDMFFYDGCALVGDTSKFKTIATYANGDAMAIIQNRIGLIGCHPESQEYWYKEPRQYINQYWHQGKHHSLLLEFVNQLMTQ